MQNMCKCFIQDLYSYMSRQLPEAEQPTALHKQWNMDTWIRIKHRKNMNLDASFRSLLSNTCCYWHILVSTKISMEVQSATRVGIWHPPPAKGEWFFCSGGWICSTEQSQCRVNRSSAAKRVVTFHKVDWIVSLLSLGHFNKETHKNKVGLHHRG